DRVGQRINETLVGLEICRVIPHVGTVGLSTFKEIRIVSGEPDKHLVLRRWVVVCATHQRIRILGTASAGVGRHGIRDFLINGRSSGDGSTWPTRTNRAPGECLQWDEAGLESP